MVHNDVFYRPLCMQSCRGWRGHTSQGFVSFGFLVSCHPVICTDKLIAQTQGNRDTFRLHAAHQSISFPVGWSFALVGVINDPQRLTVHWCLYKYVRYMYMNASIPGGTGLAVPSRTSEGDKEPLMGMCRQCAHRLSPPIILPP